MPREESLIPYQSSELTGARILVLAAHPDDESFGAGGVLALSAGAAEAIRIWIATDGSRQEGVEPENAGAYAARRREEAVAAATALGLEEPRFGGFADRSLSGSDSRRALESALLMDRASLFDGSSDERCVIQVTAAANSDRNCQPSRPADGIFGLFA